MKGLALLSVVLLTAACASLPAASPADLDGRAAVPGFAFVRDTFAFPNLIRARHPEAEDLYANYCFVLARGVRQFFTAARFEPDAPKVDGAEYARRVRAIVAHAPWRPPPPADDRVVIPGYANLREFSREQEAAVKEGLGSRFWSLVHWTNWRITFRVSGEHQAAVAREAMDELRAGRLVQLLVTNWPKPELNHTVVAYAYRAEVDAIAFTVWDPNDPGHPGELRFERRHERFWASRLYDTEPGTIRAFRMYYSRWL